MKNIYYLALEALLKNLSLEIIKKIHLTYAYENLNFIPPSKINDSHIYYVDKLDSSLNNKYENGILRLIEMEPIDVVQNYLEVKFNHILCVNNEKIELEKILKYLDEFEKDSLLTLMSRKDDRNKVDYFINNQHSKVSFIYDCNDSQFKINKFHKTNISV